MDYPPSFTAELRAHCEAGCVPPEVFRELPCNRLERLRYVRIHSAALADLCRSGEEDLRGYHRALVAAADDNSEHNALPIPATWRSRLRDVNALQTLRTLFSVRERVTCGLQRQLGLDFGSIHVVTWLPCLCFGIPFSLGMASHTLFQDGTLIPMDAASMAGVVALRPRTGDRVLDLCCSPGMKLNCLADAVTPLHATDASEAALEVVESLPLSGSVVGVDISITRQYVTRSLVMKHAGRYRRGGQPVPCVALFAADGCDFSLFKGIAAMDTSGDTPPTNVLPIGVTAQEKRQLQRGVASCQKRQREDCGAAASCATSGALTVYCPLSARTRFCRWESTPGRCLFDRVLVDAECTHDGSLSHVTLDTRADGAGKDEGGLTNHYRMQRMNVDATVVAPSTDVIAPLDAMSPADSKLVELQLRLLKNGFAQLKIGGTLVYSTCSFSFLQNEYVVWKFLTATNDELDKNEAAGCRAVPVPPFQYDHELPAGVQAHVSNFSPCGYDEKALSSLQVELDAHALDYGVRSTGAKRYCDIADVTDGSTASAYITGSRLWPHDRNTSFQFVAKIWKQPRK